MTSPAHETIETQDLPVFMDIHTLARNICTGESTIENWVRLGQFPRPKKLNGKRLWLWKEVERHIDKTDNAPVVSQAEAIREAAKRVSQGE